MRIALVFLLAVFDSTVDIVTKKLYDPTLHGVPWSELAAKARTEIKATTSEAELATILNRLLARLKASHTGFYTDSDQDYWALRSIFHGDEERPAIHQIGAWFE